MATFDLSSTGFGIIGGTAYKFYIKNHTRDTGIYYDVGLLTRGVETRWVSGPEKGTLGPGDVAICNFDLCDANDPRLIPVPKSIRSIAPQRLSRSSVSLFNVNNTPISLRFWQGGTLNQYINFIQDGPVRVTRDASDFNEVQFNKYRFTLDSGGHNNDTLDIFFQLYDV